MAQKKSSQSNKGRGCLKGCLISIVVIVLLGFGIISYVNQEWSSSEEAVLSSYKPSPEVADLAEKTGMNDKGRATLYRGKPEFLQGEAFKNKCLKSGFQGELAGGCFLSGPVKGPLLLPISATRIYLLKIDDPEFADHHYTAAAHEMLHIAYKKSLSKEKEKINALIEKEIERHKDDRHIAIRVKAMKRLKKNYQDELHSQFGVTYRDLSPELEEHYKEYFADREKLLAISENEGLAKRMRRQDELALELSELNGQLTTMRGQLNSYESSGDVENYNSLLSQFNSTVATYNARVGEVRQINGEIIQFFKYIDPEYKPPQDIESN